MSETSEIQLVLIRLGFDPGPVDGIPGRRTNSAVLEALEELESLRKFSPREKKPVVSDDWLPDVDMDRIIVHWTAGGNSASELDLQHYHIIIEGDGSLVRGKPSIASNASPLRPGYAAHTLNCNSGSIGVALAGMAGAVENPFDPGRAPITAAQWSKLASLLADLCEFYDIDVTPTKVLTHAEVQSNLGIQQRGKWDIAALPFDPSFPRSAKAVGDRMRRETVGVLVSN